MNNIVDAYPREGAVFSTKPLFQWDWGQIVRLHIRDLPATYKVEFSNSTRADAVSTVQTTEEVIVPAQFLESGNPVYAWVVVVDEARTTEYSLIIPVSARAKPTDLEPAPEERTEIEQILSALNQAVEQTAADVEAAEGYAEEAEQSAESAVTASENAIDAKEVAIAAKNTAETKASEAAASASNALTAAQNASASASQANTSAQNAASSASEAETAKENAESAKNAAQSAAQSVAHAMDTLEATIQADLQAAKESGEFDGANGKDGQDGFSPTAAVNKAGDTSTITITDKNGTTITTVKDGKDGKDGADGSPGAPGVDGTTFTPSVSAEGVISWTNDGGKTNPQPVDIKGPQGDPGDDYILTAADKAEIAQQTEELLVPVLDTKAPAIWEDASGDITMFTDGADDMSLRECVVQIKPVQEGTGDPSPENVRPITGWTGAKVQRTGKNLLDPSQVFTQINYVWYYKNNGFKFKHGVAYTLSVDRTVSSIRIVDFIDNNIVLAQAATGAGSVVYTPDSDTIGVIRLWGPGLIADELNVQLELGSTATDYEPYQSSTYDITFPTEAGTVYGGTLDVVRGVLTVDRHYCVVNPNGVAQQSSTNGYFWYTTVTSLGIPAIKDKNAKLVSNRLVANSNVSEVSQDGLITFYQNGIIRFKEQGGLSLDEYKAYLESNPLTICYGLATPITYTLTPQEIKTFLGTNNIWADTGDTAVTYPADTKMFVEQNAPESPVQDVQVNGVSVLQNGVANVPIASVDVFGATKIARGKGLYKASDDGIGLYPATDAQVKQGNDNAFALTSNKTYEIAFYGLAKAAGDRTQSASSNAVGTYTDSAKSAISTMLNGPVTVSGTTPSIAALSGIQYVCGEVSTLDITLPASGCVDVVFTSGSTPTVLTVTPPTGVTVKWANGFDPTALEANTTYEINIKDGLGVAASWT